jgi:hypothetical protein
MPVAPEQTTKFACASTRKIVRSAKPDRMLSFFSMDPAREKIHAISRCTPLISLAFAAVPSILPPLRRVAIMILRLDFVR